MSATTPNASFVYLRFAPQVTTPAQRFNAFAALRERFMSVLNTSVILCDRKTWTFRVRVPEGVSPEQLCFDGLFENTGAPADQPNLSWRQRPNSRPSSLA